MNTLWRAQMLPADGGGLLSQDQMQSLVSAHGEALDFVPLIISEFPTHNPDKAFGQVMGLEIVSDGLDVIVEASEPGSELLRAGRSLRAAGQIRLDFLAAGTTWPATLAHVLATSRHRIPGLRGFEEIR